MSRSTHTWCAALAIPYHEPSFHEKLHPLCSCAGLSQRDTAAGLLTSKIDLAQMSVRNCFIRGSVVRYVQVRTAALGLLPQHCRSLHSADGPAAFMCRPQQQQAMPSRGASLNDWKMLCSICRRAVGSCV